MTLTDRLAVLCPRCDKPGSIHCAGALCTWMECEPCSGELSRLYGMRWTVIWDSVTGKQAALPKLISSS